MAAVHSNEDSTGNCPCRSTDGVALAQWIDVILRSTNADADTCVPPKLLSQLSQLASGDIRLGQWLESIGGQPSLSWEDLLKEVLRISDQSPEAVCLRQAASAALRLRTLQARYSQALERSKRDAIYHFAYGLSHELNNPLANITTRAGVLLETSKRSDERQLLETIIDSASRGHEMLGDLMLIARPPQLQWAEVDLAELGAHIQKRGKKWSGLRSIDLVVDWQATGHAQLDQTMLCEIVWALLRNAIEASFDQRPIHLKATLADGQQIVNRCAQVPCVNEEIESEITYLCLQIDDEGGGLREEALAHCFDPYYSGREAGRGLGLGLAKAKRLSQIHGGDVTISNRPTGGCRATLWIALQ